MSDIEQAPEATESTDSGVPSITEALQTAFASEVDSVKDAPTDVVEDAPADDPEAAPEQGQARGEDGRFVKQEAKEADPEPEAKPEPEPETQFGEAPGRFSPDAKAAWAKAPEPIKAEIHRAMREMETGLQGYREQLEPLKPFFAQAEQAGVKLSDALQGYRETEVALYNDPGAGGRGLAQRLGMSPQDFAGAILGVSGQDLVSALTGQQPGNGPDPRDAQIADMQNQIAQLSQGYQQVNGSIQQQHEQQVMASVEQFAAQHPRFDELSEDIAKLLNTGYASTLEDAYSAAERLKPVTMPEPTPVQTPPPPAQTRQAKSVTGSPSNGSQPNDKPIPKTAREAITRYF